MNRFISQRELPEECAMPSSRPLCFALFFGNRGFFPETLIAGARSGLQAVVEQAGYRALLLDPGATRFGAVETVQEGQVYARFLIEHLQDKLLAIGRQGYRHHVSVAFGSILVPVREALQTYLGYSFESLAGRGF
jgi:hypothetical protein